MSNVSTRFTSALSNLKSKDDRKRRRAIRELFEIDDEKHLSAFIPLLTDKDIWYRSKAVDAFRMWSPRQEVSSLEPLIVIQNIEFNRVAANLLEKFKPCESDIVKNLFSKPDIICKLRSAEFILKSDGEDSFFSELLKNNDPRIRIIALESKYSDQETMTQFLNDESLKVVEYCLDSLNQSGHEMDDNILDILISRGIKSSLLMPQLIENNPHKLVEFVDKMDNHDTKVLVELLRERCNNLNDEPINTLINSEHQVIVGRWLQGKKGPDEDALRWRIICNEEIDEIERSRFLERLFSRCNEDDIISKASEIANNSVSELIRVTAHNLSTANDRV